MPSIPVPSDSTDTYLCVDFELPGTFESPQHIVEYDAIINTSKGFGQTKYVHHMFLLNCSERPSTFPEAGTVQVPYKCLPWDMEWTCNAVTLEAGNAPMSKMLPSEAGFRIGKGSMRYVTLQVHYNNVAKDHPVDRSGFRIHYTSKLRPHDLGVMTLGWEYFSIPSRTLGWDTGYSVCAPSCTSRFTAPITIAYDVMHMHRLGVSVITRHATPVSTTPTSGSGSAGDDEGYSVGGRGGEEEEGERGWQELRPIGQRDYWDFNFHTLADVPSETAVVYPGDALMTKCTFNNSGGRPVDFGSQTSDEMCYSFLMFYPLSAAGGVVGCTDIGVGFRDMLGMSVCRDASIDLSRLLTETFKQVGLGSSSLFAAAMAIMGMTQAHPETFVSAQTDIPNLMVPYEPPTCPAGGV